MPRKRPSSESDAMASTSSRPVESLKLGDIMTQEMIDKTRNGLESEELHNLFDDFLARLSEMSITDLNPSMMQYPPTEKKKEKQRQVGPRSLTFDRRWQDQADKFNAESQAALAAGKIKSTTHYALLDIDPATAPTNDKNIPKGGRIITSQPQSGYLTDMLDGQTECILLSMRDKAQILNTPGFPQAIPRPRNPGAFVIREVPGMGLGMVAARDIKFGELICSERPLLITTSLVRGYMDKDAVKGKKIPTNIREMTEEFREGFQDSIDEQESTIQQALIRMNERARGQFMALHDCHADEGTSGPLLGRVRTNGYGIFSSAEYPKGTVWYTAVFNYLSRINHSCSPNTYSTWHYASLSRQCYAARPIAKGEEITTTYIGMTTPYAERKSLLQGYRITCTCTACTNPHSYLTKLNNVKDNFPAIIKWASNPAFSDNLLLIPMQQLMITLVNEGQHAHPAYKKLVYGLACVYYVLGEWGAANQLFSMRVRIDENNGLEWEEEMDRDLEKLKQAMEKSGRKLPEREEDDGEEEEQGDDSDSECPPSPEPAS
ncbi:hypothetical protein ONZ45_g1172 [Pleurotus djamor]|nr:hypothetical protein ONZ45_g1172 [Pleurotus djamor]